MFKLIYNFSLLFYYCVVFIISFFNKKAKLWIKGREKLLNTILKSDADKFQNIWFHVSSLGEFEQARPLIELIKLNNPEYKIVLTFFSPSGFEIRKNYKFADYIWYLPIDLKSKAYKFVNFIKPAKAFFVKYDFWYNYLETLDQKHVPTYLISGIFRKKQIFFKKIGKAYSKVLGFFDHLFIQNEESAKLLESIGIKNYTIAGDTRFDRVIEIAENSKELPMIKNFVKSEMCLVAGSTWAEDENLLKKIINGSHYLKFIIAPHEINDNHISELIRGISKKVVKYSEYESNQKNDCEVLIIDNIGMLSTIYKYGQIAYIGGGFGTGIHNIVEPAVYGMPVIFGPKYKKFNEAVEMLEIKCAFSIKNYEELYNIFSKLISDQSFLSVSSSKSKEFVYVNKGATQIIYKNIFKKI